MKVRVRLFGAARELAGSNLLEMELPAGATIGDLRQAVVEKLPALAQIVSHSLWAVGSEYVSAAQVLDEKSDVALIPPVSGG
jgi:molybdopterin converting factor subunit 1